MNYNELQFRHGDVMIAATKLAAVPPGAKQHKDGVLARGESTGHAHRIATPANATLWELDGQLYMKVVAPTRIEHEEHAALEIAAPGVYRVWQQREYSPQAIRRVQD